MLDLDDSVIEIRNGNSSRLGIGNTSDIIEGINDLKLDVNNEEKVKLNTEQHENIEANVNRYR